MATSARPVALITGASAGIGAALAREAANDGHDLVLVARRREPMEALAAELKSTGAEITVIPADLNRPGAAAELMKTVEQRGLAIDTLINNAGLGDTGQDHAPCVPSCIPARSWHGSVLCNQVLRAELRPRNRP